MSQGQCQQALAFSSATMVVASTLAFLAVNNKLEGVTKRAFVEMAMENEKRVGVNSGGYVPYYHRAAFGNTNGIAEWTRLFLSS